MIKFLIFKTSPSQSIKGTVRTARSRGSIPGRDENFFLAAAPQLAI